MKKGVGILLGMFLLVLVLVQFASALSCDDLNNLITSSSYTSCGNVNYDKRADLDKDKSVNQFDLSLFVPHNTDETWCEERLADNTDPCLLQTQCSGCSNCDVWYNLLGSDCPYEECIGSCQQAEGSTCYFKGNIFGVSDCVTQNEVCSEINSCSDYSIEECMKNSCNIQETCVVSSTGCADINSVNIVVPQIMVVVDENMNVNMYDATGSINGIVPYPFEYYKAVIPFDNSGSLGSSSLASEKTESLNDFFKRIISGNAVSNVLFDNFLDKPVLGMVSAVVGDDDTTCDGIPSGHLQECSIGGCPGSRTCISSGEWTPCQIDPSCGGGGTCGDGICNSDEASTCPQDCGGGGGGGGCIPYPASYVCGENSCGLLNDNCGNQISCGTCNEGETCGTIPPIPNPNALNPQFFECLPGTCTYDGLCEPQIGENSCTCWYFSYRECGDMSCNNDGICDSGEYPMRCSDCGEKRFECFRKNRNGVIGDVLISISGDRFGDYYKKLENYCGLGTIPGCGCEYVNGVAQCKPGCEEEVQPMERVCEAKKTYFSCVSGTCQSVECSSSNEGCIPEFACDTPDASCCNEYVASGYTQVDSTLVSLEGDAPDGATRYPLNSIDITPPEQGLASSSLFTGNAVSGDLGTSTSSSWVKECIENGGITGIEFNVINDAPASSSSITHNARFFAPDMIITAPTVLNIMQEIVEPSESKKIRYCIKKNNMYINTPREIPIGVLFESTDSSENSKNGDSFILVNINRFGNGPATKNPQLMHSVDENGNEVPFETGGISVYK